VPSYLRRAVLFALVCLLAVASGANAAPPVNPDLVQCRPVQPKNLVNPPPPVWQLTGEAPPTSAEVRAQRPRVSPCAEGEVAYPIARSGPRKGVPLHQKRESPEWLGPAAPPELASNEGYSYAGNEWQGPAIGGAFSTAIAKPTVSGVGPHSLVQLAISRFTSNEMTVEFGWNVDRSLYGNANPHLFTYVNKDNYSTNGKPGGDCYNCNFTPFAGASFVPGQELSPSGTTAVQFAALYFEGNWWLAVQGSWIGYLNSSFWGGVFTSSQRQLYFGEVYDPGPAPTTQMGNGTFGSDIGSLVMGLPYLFTTGGVVETSLPPLGPNIEPLPGWYNIGNITDDRRAWTIGGPGAASGAGPDPRFTLMNKATGKCMDVWNASPVNTVPIQQWTCEGAANRTSEAFYLLPSTSPYFQIVPRLSGKCVDVRGASLEPTAAIQQYSCLGSGQANQLWRFEPVGEGYYQVIAKHSGQCAEIASGNGANGAPLDQYTCLGAAQANQLWKLNYEPGSH
jgi:hypothetical protein